jgi:hypothetical protein
LFPYINALIKIFTMKKLFFIFIFAFALNSNAQITYEHSYDSASSHQSYANLRQNQLMIINFEISGFRFVRVNYLGKSICIYNMNHVLLKAISLAALPQGINNATGDVLYMSESLFDLDPLLEFMYIYSFIDSTNHTAWHTLIVKENGTIMFSDDGIAEIKVNLIQQQMPIYNTPLGTKMILSYIDGHAEVFNLGGSLTTNIAKANNVLLEQNGISNAYPNPTANRTQIDYMLPKDVNEGEIVLYDLNGIEVKRFKVDRTFTTLLVSVADIPAGTYYYQLHTTSHNSEGKKMVVIK